MARVLFNVNAGGNEKSIPAELLVSKRIKSVSINFDASTVNITYEGESDAKESTTSAGDNVDSAEVSSESEPKTLTGAVSPVNETAEIDGADTIEKVADEDRKEARKTAPVKVEEADVAKKGDSDTTGERSSVEGSPGVKKTSARGRAGDK